MYFLVLQREFSRVLSESLGPLETKIKRFDGEKKLMASAVIQNVAGQLLDGNEVSLVFFAHPDFEGN